jgi:hypothetical protein
MIKLEDKPNTIPPSVDYPFGDIKDVSTGNPGTPVSRQVYADFHQFFAKMFAESGLTANDLPDNETNGFQLFDALDVLTDAKNPKLICSISQTGTSAPTVSTIKDRFGFSGIAGNRSGAGSYTITFTPSLSAGSVPLGFFPSLGIKGMDADHTVDAWMANGRIYIETRDNGTLADFILDEFIFELVGYV